MKICNLSINNRLYGKLALSLELEIINDVLCVLLVSFPVADFTLLSCGFDKFAFALLLYQTRTSFSELFNSMLTIT